MVCHQLLVTAVIVLFACVALAVIPEESADGNQLEGRSEGKYGNAAYQAVNKYLSMINDECRKNTIEKCGLVPTPSSGNPRKFLSCATNYYVKHCYASG